MMIPEKAFGGFSVITVAHLLQLASVETKRIFSQFSDKSSMKNLKGLELRHLFEYPELTEVVRRNDILFINLLNKVRVGNINHNVEKLLQVRFIHQPEENYPRYALDLYAENEPAMKMNKAVLNDLVGELYAIKANNKIPSSFKYPVVLIHAAQNQKQANTKSWAKLLQLKNGAKAMLTVNIDIKDRLVNSQNENISHTEFLDSLFNVNVKLSDEQAGLKAMWSSYLCMKKFLACYWKMWD